MRLPDVKEQSLSVGQAKLVGHAFLGFLPWSVMVVFLEVMAMPTTLELILSGWQSESWHWVLLGLGTGECLLHVAAISNVAGSNTKRGGSAGLHAVADSGSLSILEWWE